MDRAPAGRSWTELIAASPRCPRWRTSSFSRTTWSSSERRARPDPDPRPALGRQQRVSRSISPSRPSWPIPPSTAEPDTDRHALQLRVADHAVLDLRLQHGHAASSKLLKRQEVLGRLRPEAATRPSGSCAPARDGAPGADLASSTSKGIATRRRHAAAALRLRLLRLLARDPAFNSDAPEPARPRLRLSPSPTSAAGRRWAAPGTTTASCSRR
ncbi:MAG: hypothetical protein M0C28_00405 [Candidatus Moduliflexus flocculans]|nr:hypothetical protein [Candidatus Moduliflexus flocculans]